MRTEQIEFLKEINKTHSINVAANNLCISPQALSKSMKSLEQELGFKILETTHTGTSLNDNGEEFLQKGLDFLLHIKTMQAKNIDFKKFNKIYEIPVTFGIIETILPNFILYFKHTYQGNIISKTIPFSNIMIDLLTNKIEYCLAFRAVISGENIMKFDDRFEFIHVKNISYYCKFNKNMQLTTQKTISLKEMTKYKIILYRDDNKEIFAYKELFYKINPNANVQLYNYRKLYETTLLNEDVVTLILEPDDTTFINDKFSYIPISDKDTYAEVGILKLKNKKIAEDSSNLLQILKNYMLDKKE